MGGGGAGAEFAAPGIREGRSAGVPLHPVDIAVHPSLQEAPAVRPNASVGVEQAVLRLDEGFRLAERRHIEIGQDAAQLLLCDGGADGADRYPDHPRRLVLPGALRSEEHTSELQSLMRISYAVFCLKKKN